MFKCKESYLTFVNITYSIDFEKKIKDIKK